MLIDRARHWEWPRTAWRRMGVSGSLLAAAVLADLLVAAATAISQPEPWRPLVMLPGAFGLAACALLARRSPLVAPLLAAVVLVACSPLAQLRSSSYVAVLAGISISETVAGVLLVILSVRLLPPLRAFAATAMLVVGCVAAVVLRGYLSGVSDPGTAFAGLALLVVGVLIGIRTRVPDDGSSPVSPDLGPYLSQWPLIGAFALIVFLEFASSAGSASGTVGMLSSVAAAALAVVAGRHPVAAGLALAPVFLLSGGLLGATDFAMRALPMSATQVLAGCVVVVHLVRSRGPGVTIGVIAVLSATVAGVTLAHVGFRDAGPLAGSAVFVLGFAVATGLYLRSRDSARSQVLSAAVTEAQSAERMALARELHDVVAHHVTGIVVQAQAAKMLADQDPTLAQDALDRIERAGIEAMGAMRRLVGSMRSGTTTASEADATDQATTDLADDLRRLVATSNHGVTTELDLDLGADLPPEVARSALRIVQEALTNVGKHATGATTAKVAVGVVDRQLGIRVGDDGRPQPGERTPGDWRDGGYGLVGMRERVQLLHGRLSAGPAPDGGWVVEVWLPLEDVRR